MTLFMHKKTACRRVRDSEYKPIESEMRCVGEMEQTNSELYKSIKALFELKRNHTSKRLISIIAKNHYYCYLSTIYTFRVAESANSSMFSIKIKPIYMGQSHCRSFLHSIGIHKYSASLFSAIDCDVH